MPSSPDTESASSLDEVSSYTSIVSSGANDVGDIEASRPTGKTGSNTGETFERPINGDGGEEQKCERRRCCSAAQIKAQAAAQLEIELRKTQQDLKLKDEEITKLSSIRNKMEAEVEELTASLFEEANNKVRAANIHKARAERNLREAKMKIDVLLAEVDALKTLVKTSTSLNTAPSSSSSIPPSLSSLSSSTATASSHFTPHSPATSLTSTLETSIRNSLNKAQQTILRSSPSTPKKSPSNYELNTNSSHQFTNSVAKMDPLTMINHENDLFGVLPNAGEVDPAFHAEFVEWKHSPTIDKNKSVFIKRIYDEEILPVFNFKNMELTEQTLKAIEENSIIVESVSDKATFPKKCALLDIPRTCKYRMKLGDNWYNVSELCRNRIISVCDLLCYLRYIQDGLVKSGFHDIYWEVMRRRRNIALSRFGFPCMQNQN